jgi:hypothetical protein
MDHGRFDRITRAFAAGSSRRSAVKTLGGSAVALLLGQLSFAGEGEGSAATKEVDGERKKKGKKKGNKEKLKLNAFRCVDVGGKCRGNSANCCSGICQGQKPKKGKKDKSRCVAHNTGDCQDVQDVCLEVEVACGSGGACLRTTGNASFCGDGGQCANCQTDSDCEAAGFLEGAACVVCSDCSQSGVACFRAGA